MVVLILLIPLGRETGAERKQKGKYPRAKTWQWENRIRTEGPTPKAPAY